MRSHVKKQRVPHQHVPHTQDDNTGGDLLPRRPPAQLRTKLNNDYNVNNDNDNNDNNKCNRTLIVGPSVCGKTHLLLNKLQLFRLSDSEKQIHIITRSSGQYNGLHKNLGPGEASQWKKI